MTAYHYIARAVAILLLASSALMAKAASPIPDTTGPYVAGRLSLDLLDASRDEVFSEDSTDKRRLLVDVYYPAAASGTARATYASAALMNVFRYNDEQRAWTAPVYADVPAADDEFPLLIFSPGLGNASLYYSSLLHEVASRGYVVAMLWHPYSTSVVGFPDGTVIRSNEAGSVAGDTLAEQMAELERLGTVWVADQRFVLDTLTDIETTPPILRGHIDSNRIGAFGHSFGGAAAAATARDDERLKAAIDMDGTLFGSVVTGGSRVPFLYLDGDPPPPTDEQLKSVGETREEFDAEELKMSDALNRTLAAGANSKLIKFENARHNAFWTDQLFFSKNLTEEQRKSRIGDIDPDATFMRIHTTITEFFDKYLAK